MTGTLTIEDDGKRMLWLIKYQLDGEWVNEDKYGTLEYAITNARKLTSKGYNCRIENVYVNWE